MLENSMVIGDYDDESCMCGRAGRIDDDREDCRMSYKEMKNHMDIQESIWRATIVAKLYQEPIVKKTLWKYILGVFK